MSPHQPACKPIVLRRRAEFLAVAGHGKKWVTPSLILQMKPQGVDLLPPALRYGLTASRKVGNAVTRNRARRRLRALVQEVLPQHGKVGCDYVLIARPATVTRAYDDLRKDLVWALKRIENATPKPPA